MGFLSTWQIQLNLCFLRPTRVHNPNGTVQPFCTAHGKVPILYTGRPFPTKIALSHGGIWTPISVMIPWASLSRQWRCSASQDSCISSPFYLIIHWSQQMIQYWYYSKTGCDGMGMCCEKKTLIMVALRNTADHYIFALWFLPSFFPRLIPAVGNWMSTILHTQCGLSAI